MRKILYVFLFGFLMVLFACSSDESKQESVDDAGNVAVDKTLAVLNRKIADDVENDELYIQRADYYLSISKPDSALRDILIAIDIDAENTNHFITLSDAYLAIGNPDKCLEALDRSLELDAQNQKALLKKAQLYLIMRNYDQCHETIARLVSIDKFNPSAYYLNAVALIEEGDTSLAIKNLQVSVDQKQDFFEAQLQLGILFSSQKNPLAISYLQNAITLNPKTIEPYYQLGLFFQENNRIESAIKTYNSILDIEPEFVPAIYNLGYIQLVYLQEFAKAVDYFSQVVQMAPEYTEAWYNRAYCYELLGQDELARNDYQQTIKLAGNYQKAIEGLNRLDSN